jgi:hypothetical protein
LTPTGIKGIRDGESGTVGLLRNPGWVRDFRPGARL